jgi:hypothetical protein
MSGWYVSYRAGAATVMILAKSRDEAISAACGLLDRKINVQEIGPLLGMRHPGDIIDSVEIRRLHAMRTHAE